MKRSVNVENVPPNDVAAAVEFVRRRRAEGGPEEWEMDTLLTGMDDPAALLAALDDLE